MTLTEKKQARHSRRDQMANERSRMDEEAENRTAYEKVDLRTERIRTCLICG
jgi:hypothetical protein